MDRKKGNAEYYARTRDRIILRENELRPSTILEIIDCLEELELLSDQPIFDTNRAAVGALASAPGGGAA